MLYLTDTGRRWDGERMSVRDKVVVNSGSSGSSLQEEIIEFQNKYRFRSTFDIIKSAEKGELPDKIMIIVHPQRWHNKPLPWLKELVWQNTKNIVKKLVVRLN